MAAGRRQLIRELQAAEARLETQWQQVLENGEARVEYLRRTHPAWLIGGGFAAGVVAERMLAVLAGSALASLLVSSGLRLWPVLSGITFPGFLTGKPAP